MAANAKMLVHDCLIQLQLLCSSNGFDRMSRPPAEPESSAVQALLGLSDILRVTRSQRYHALWLFADQLLPALAHTQGGSVHRKEASQDLALVEQLPLLLFAVACLLLAIEHSDLSQASSTQGSKQALKRVYTAASCALDDSFSACNTSNELREAAVIVQSQVKIRKQQLTSDHLLEMHSKFSEAGMTALQSMDIDNCCRILELLYASKAYRRSQPLECGGKLLASAIIAAAFAITVAPSKVTTLPFLSWLSELAQHPNDVIKAQTEQILSYVLGQSV